MKSLCRALQSPRSSPLAPTIAYLTIADPSGDDFRKAAQQLMDAGCIALELGFPTTTPDDSEVLRRSHARVRISIDVAWTLFEQVSQEGLPLIAVTYVTALSTLEAAEAFVARAAQHAASATLIVGLPLMWLSRYQAISLAAGIETVLSVSPSMPPALRQKVYAATSGCIYLSAPTALSFLPIVLAETALPIVVGRGLRDRSSLVAMLDAGARAGVLGGPVVERVELGLELKDWMRQWIRGP